MKQHLPPLLLAALAALAAAGPGHVPSSGWPVLLSCAALGGLAGSLLLAAITRLRRRSWPRRATLTWAGLGLLGLGWLALAPAGPAVIVVVIDCMRADRLSPETSPNLDSLARDGYRFLAARSQAPWTRSSVPSLLSGRMPVEHGMYRVRPKPDRLKDGITLVSEVFQRAGWSTAGFVQQGQLDAAFGMARGYDRYSSKDGWAPRLTRRFLAWHALHRTLPRFVYLHYLDAHGPYWPSEAFRPRDLPKTTLSTHGADRWRQTITDIRAGKLHPTAQDYAWLGAMYSGEIREIDDWLGEILTVLRLDGSLDHALVVVTADHGEMLGEHGDVEHMRTPWEVLLHVPLLIHPPGGLPEGREISEVVEQVDLVPTLLSAEGLPLPAGLAGRDLAPLLRGETLPARPSFAEEWSRPTRRAAVRWGDWKWIREGAQGRLYDLAKDPGEAEDLAAQAPERVAEGEGLLAAYFAAAEAEKPLSEVDWEAAARSGATWAAGAEEAPTDASAVPAEVMEQLERLGYLDDAP